MYGKNYLTSTLIRELYYSIFNVFNFLIQFFLVNDFFFSFFIRSSMIRMNNSLLDEKYNNVIKSICEMMLPMKIKRPTCEQLLNSKSQWDLSMSQIQNDLMFKKFKNLSISELLTKNNFCNYFIKMKSMHK
jgi:hypothetical protein